MARVPGRSCLQHVGEPAPAIAELARVLPLVIRDREMTRRIVARGGIAAHAQRVTMPVIAVTARKQGRG